MQTEKIRTWVDSKMIGVLEIAQIGKSVLPMVQIRLVGVDGIGVRRGSLMTYELPLNFVFSGGLTNVFSSV
jgi:hypothetical protein